MAKKEKEEIVEVIEEEAKKTKTKNTKKTTNHFCLHLKTLQIGLQESVAV